MRVFKEVENLQRKTGKYSLCLSEETMENCLLSEQNMPVLASGILNEFYPSLLGAMFANV